MVLGYFYRGWAFIQKDKIPPEARNKYNTKIKYT